MLKVTFNSLRRTRRSAFKVAPRNTKRNLAYHHEGGIGLLIVIIAIAVVLLVGIVIATPEIRTQLLPQPSSDMSASNISVPPPPSPTPSEKQELYIKNKELIKKKLNLDDTQFDILVQNAGIN